MSISLCTAAYNGYWSKHGEKWSRYVNNLNTQPNEIIIVSDEKIDTSFLNHQNIKNVLISKNDIHKASLVSNNILYLFRNIAAQHSSCEWVVASDLDDIPYENYLDNLDYSSDIHAFSFFDKSINKYFYPKENCLSLRLNGGESDSDSNLIPGTSAIKKHLFEKIRYESGCFEDKIFYSSAYKLNAKVAFDDTVRFEYSGFHSFGSKREKTRLDKIYTKVLNEDRNIYCFWFSKEMNENRKKSLDILKKYSKCNIILLNYDNFFSYEKQEIPIHEGFQYLSDIQKSDYARAYIMYFYGEGYSDIKRNNFDWNPYFEQLFLSNKTAIGYSTDIVEDIGQFWENDLKMAEECKKNYMKIAGNGHYIFKPKTSFAYEWLMMINKKMDDNYEKLKNNPGIHPLQVKNGIDYSLKGDPQGYPINNDYPFGWAEIGGLIKHKIEYFNNFNDFILTMPHCNLNDYR